jgi:hypothetical protein
VTIAWPGYTVRWGLFAVLALPCSVPGRAAAPLLRAALQFSSEAVTIPSPVIIEVPEKQQVYRLLLEPDFDVRHHVISLFLALHHLNDPPTTRNLIDTTGSLHGYQEYIFLITHLAQPPGTWYKP